MSDHGAELLGPKSSRLQDLRRLSGRRRARLDAGAFVVDGPVLVAEALRAGLVTDVYTERGSEESTRALAAERGVAVHDVAPGALAKVTDPVTPQGVAARARIPSAPTLAEVGDLVLVLVEVADPGNVGTLVRAAEAAGASAVLSVGDGADVWSPKCVRSSAGALFRVPVAVDRSTDALGALARSGTAVLAMTGSAAAAIDEVDLTGPVAIVVGNEAHGLDPAVVAAADRAVAIPMHGAVESLNVAMAGTVALFEAARQRRRR